MFGKKLFRLVAGVTCLLMPSLASAQETGRPWGFLSANADLTAKPESAPPLDLRANVTVPVYLYIVNSNEDTPTVSVQIRAGGMTVGTVAAVTLSANSLTRFAIAQTPMPAGKAAPAEGMPVVVDNKTKKHTFKVAVSNVNKITEASNDATQVLNFVSPSTYLGETTAIVAGTGNQLTVAVKSSKLQGPPCKVKLVLSPDEIPGLQLDGIKGVTEGTLTAEQPTTNLVVAGLAFAPGAKGEGSLSLTVDGVERAVVMKGSFKSQAGARTEQFKLETNRVLRVIAPKFAKPGDDVTAKFEAINVPENAQVTFTVTPVGSAAPVQTMPATGSRERNAFAKVADDGSLGVKTVLKDWAFKFETTGLYGPITLKGSAASDGDLKEASTVILFDDSPPVNLQFLEGDKMKPPVKGRKYGIRTVGEDKDSQITKVEYFVGAEPPAAGPDGKVPAEPKPVLAMLDPKSTKEAPVWSAEINLPEKAGATPVFARFTNGVGLTTVAKTVLEVLDPPPGTVKGKVMFGDRAQKADVTVWLMSKDGKTVVKDTKVTAEGIFEIKDVPAGDYVLYAEQKTSGKPIAGTASVTIKEGPPVTEQNVVLKK